MREGLVFTVYRPPFPLSNGARTISHRKPLIVHFDDLGVGQFGAAPDVLSTFAPHNVEHRIVELAARTAGGTRRAFASVE